MRLLKALALLGACGALLPNGAQAAWSQAKSRHFTVYSEGNVQTLEKFAEKLEKFDFLLRKVTKVTDPEAGSPVQVYLLNNGVEVKSLAGNPNAGGFYTTSDRVAYAVLARSNKTSKFDLGSEEILFHEYTHHFMLHHFPAAYPAWYIEGFAEFFSVVNFPRDGSMEFGNVPIVRIPTLVMASPFPLKSLFSRGSNGLSLREGDRYYGTAWLLTHYFLYNSARRDEFYAYLDDLGKSGETKPPASYFAGGLDALEKELRAYMRHRPARSSLQPNSMKIDTITISPVDPEKGELIDDELRLMGRPSSEEIAKSRASIRQIAARYPKSGYAAAILAEADWSADDAAAALADADRAIALDPTLSRAWSTRARVLLEKAHESDKAEDWKAALTAIVKANRADTEDPVPLALFYRYHAMKGGKMPDVGYDGLVKAYSLLPQNPEYRMTLVHAMATKGDYATASKLLDPLAYSPHGSDMRDAALKLKAEFNAKLGVKEEAEPEEAAPAAAAPAAAAPAGQ